MEPHTEKSNTESEVNCPGSRGETEPEEGELQESAFGGRLGLLLLGEVEEAGESMYEFALFRSKAEGVGRIRGESISESVSSESSINWEESNVDSYECEQEEEEEEEEEEGGLDL